MPRKYYNEDPDFRQVIDGLQDGNEIFIPCAQAWISERQAEQNAFFWFMQGQMFVLREWAAKQATKEANDNAH